MDLKHVLVTLLLIAAVELLISLGVFQRLNDYFCRKIVQISGAVLLHRIFPDGLLSLGALLVLKEYIIEKTRAVYVYLRQRLQHGSS